MTHRELDRHCQVVVVHSSNEMYGADRMLLRVLEGMKPHVGGLKVMLPDDATDDPASLRHSLAADRIAAEVRPLPVLRRAYLNPGGLARIAANGWSLWRSFRRGKPSLVWCATSAVLIAGLLARLSGVPTVALHVQEIWGRWERLILGALALSCGSIVAISQPVADSLPAFLRRRVIVLTNGSEDPGQPVPLNATDDCIRLLVASRWNRWKGHGTLIQAMASSHNDISLVIAGGPPPSGDAADVPHLVSRYGLQDAVRIVGEVNDIGKLIDESHFVIVPSDGHEPFGLVAIEAFARGRAVIGSAGGGLGEIITHGKDGYLFPNADIEALVMILNILNHQNALAMGDRARETFKRLYSDEVFQTKFQAYFAGLIQHSSATVHDEGPGQR